MVGLFIVSLTFAMGCQKQDGRPPKADVSGSVTFQGKPVPEGQINFLSGSTGMAAAAVLQTDGKFVVEGGLEPGEYKVSITPPPSEDVAGAPQTSPPKEYPDIPLKYRSDVTSELKTTVEPGGSQLSFDMQP